MVDRTFIGFPKIINFSCSRIRCLAELSKDSKDSYFGNLSIFPTISFIIPTYNADDTLEDCLTSVFSQDYPRDKIEVLVVDGGSKDRTLEQAGQFPVKVVFNKKPLPFNQEGNDGGKAQGVRASKGEFVVLLDADNILSSKDWLRKTIQTFIADPEIVACETSRFVCRFDPPVNRYCSALVTKTPRQDPFVLSHSDEPVVYPANEAGVIVFTADARDPPCLANGTTVRSLALEKVGGYDYDWDTGNRLVKMGYSKFCKITTVGIYHKYVESLNGLIKKAVWRIRYLLYSPPSRSTKKMFSNTMSDKQSRSILVRDVLNGLTFIGPLLYAVKQFKNDRDYAWFYHPIVYFLIPLTYALVLIGTPKGVALFLNSQK